jgi:F0F1-type ATP synthase alpha subunit
VLNLSDPENAEVVNAFKEWAKQMDNHQYQIIVNTAKIVELLKQKKVSAKTKNEMIIVIKGLQATVKSVTKVLSKFLE